MFNHKFGEVNSAKKTTSKLGNRLGTAFAAGALAVSVGLGGVYPQVDSAQAASSAGFTKACDDAGGINNTNSLGQGTCSFGYSGTAKTFKALAGKYKFETWGAQGGYSGGQAYGGKGGYSAGFKNILNDTPLYVYVGQAGIRGHLGIQTVPGAFNGGGKGFQSLDAKHNYYAASGGGATDIRTIENNLPSRLIVAGAGGGAAGYRYGDNSGGHGGGPAGLVGTNTKNTVGEHQIHDGAQYNNGGGSQSSGGVVFSNNGGTPESGFFGRGGSGLKYDYQNDITTGGGGGGWYGGAGGAAGGSGGGGSSYIDGVTSDTVTGVTAKTLAGNQGMPTPPNITGGTGSQIGQSNNGYAVITELNTLPSLTASGPTVTSGTDTVTVGTLNYVGTGKYSTETVNYKFTATNTSAYSTSNPKIDVTSAIPSEWSCTPLSTTATTLVINSGSLTLDVKCQVPKSWFLNAGGNSQPVPQMSANLTGTFNTSPTTAVNSPATTNSTLNAQTIRSAVSFPSAPVLSMSTVVGQDQGAPGQIGLGDTMKITTLVKNDGTTTLNNISVTSPARATHPDYITTCTATPLAPGASATCTTTYKAIAKDAAGSTYSDTMTAYGTPNVCSTDTCSEINLGSIATNTLPVETTKISATNPSITIVNDVAPFGILSAGDTLKWSTTVTNDGTVGLKNITVKDQANRIYTGTYTSPLNPKGTSVFTSPNYVMTATDAKNTPYVETVTATAEPNTCSTSCGIVTGINSSSNDLAAYSPTYNISNRTTRITTDKYTAGKVDLGDVVKYSIQINNTGNIPWNSANITDARGLTYTCNPNTNIAASAYATCTATTTAATKADLQTSTIDWTPKVIINPSYGGEQIVDTQLTTSLPTVAPAGSIKIVNKTATGPYQPETEVYFTYEVQNTGNINVNTLGVKVTDNKSDTLNVTCPKTTLIPNEITKCTASKIVN